MSSLLGGCGASAVEEPDGPAGDQQQQPTDPEADVVAEVRVVAGELELGGAALLREDYAVLAAGSDVRRPVVVSGLARRSFEFLVPEDSYRASARHNDHPGQRVKPLAPEHRCRYPIVSGPGGGNLAGVLVA